MKVYLQCWWNGKCTINLEVNDVSPEIKIIDLLNIYFNCVINPATNPSYTWDYCYPKIELCGRFDKIYDKNLTLSHYGFGENDTLQFTVLTGFTY